MGNATIREINHDIIVTDGHGEYFFYQNTLPTEYHTGNTNNLQKQFSRWRGQEYLIEKA